MQHSTAFHSLFKVLLKSCQPFLLPTFEEMERMFDRHSVNPGPRSVLPVIGTKESVVLLRAKEA